MKWQRRTLDALSSGLLVSVVLVVFLPLLWVTLSSFKTPAAINQPLNLFFDPTMMNWQEVWDGGIPEAALRSFVVATTSVGISLLVGSMGAYVIAKYKTGGDLTRFGILTAQVLPPAVLVFAFLAMAYALRLNDTLAAVVFAHVALVLPVVTWFLIGFFEAVPKEIEEQARVDGLTRFEAFRRVVVPHVLPGIGAAAVFWFTLSWNDLFYALILAPGNAKTLPVAIAGFNTFRGVEIGAMSAAILVSVVPVLTASFFIQRKLVRGISGGALKY